MYKGTSTAPYSESQQMVISRCPHLSAANTFTFMSPAHSFNPDSTARSLKTTRQQMAGCLETCAQRGTAFHRHRERRALCALHSLGLFINRAANKPGMAQPEADS